MPKNGAVTREKILATANTLILNNGFTGTSIDRLIEEVGITKGAFFYHFKSKSALARALLERNARHQGEMLESWMARAEKISRDPLQQLLIFVGQFIEFGDNLKEPYSGCLLASYCYQKEAFDDEVKKMCRDGFLDWRKKVGGKIRQVMEQYPPARPIDPDSLADNMIAVLECAFIISKYLNDTKIVAQQMTHYSYYLENLFTPNPHHEKGVKEASYLFAK